MVYVYIFFLCTESNGSAGKLNNRQPESQGLKSLVGREKLMLSTTALNEPLRLRFQEGDIQLSNERARSAPEPLFSNIVAHATHLWKSSSVELPHPHFIFTTTNTVSECSVELLLLPFIANITTIVRLSIFKLPHPQSSTPTNIPRGARIHMTNDVATNLPGLYLPFLVNLPIDSVTIRARTRSLEPLHFFTANSDFCAPHHWADMCAHPHLGVRL